MKKKLVFITGIERSGSTWLLNIFDANKDVLSYMEPFAQELNIFPHFLYDRFLYLSENNYEMEQFFNGFLSKLYKLKYPLFLDHTSPFIFSLFLSSLFNMHAKLVSLFKGYDSLRSIQYRKLNLHTNEIKGRLVGRTNSDYTHVFIKELRVFFKIKLIDKVLMPDYYLVIVRNPYSHVNSILNWFKKGSLTELRKEIISFPEILYEQVKFGKYLDYIKLNREIDLVEKVLLYWLITYNTLLEDIPPKKLIFINHEEMSNNPEDSINKICKKIGLTIDNSMLKFISKSTKRKGENISSNMDVFRDSKKLVRKSLLNVDKKLRERIKSDLEKMKPIMNKVLVSYIDIYNEL